ncbi:MAG: NAD(P)/FAD-dependent oxidoreductase [Elusimicrobia bacterium]|nr:NAD(P)/FAD-dependent oxidoreductase [Elusimicrobiota bacterium]
MPKYDIVVIGAGPAGTSAAIRAAQLGVPEGLKVCLIEQNALGGTCLNAGCMPTKFLSEAVNNIRKISKLSSYGLKANLEPFELNAIMAKKNQMVNALRKGNELKIKSYGIEIISGSARFKNASTIVVDGAEISAGKIIIAAGSVPAEISGLEINHDNIIDSTDILNLEVLPESLFVVGGGAIGVEMATIFSSLGVRVTIAEYADALLPNEDKEIVAEIQKNFARQGVEVITDCKSIVEVIKGLSPQKVLVAVGRKFNDNLGLKAIGLEFTPKGFIKTDEAYKTNIENIYAAGDCTGKGMLAYTASNYGVEAVESIFGQATIIENGVTPYAVFSSPPAASVKTADFDKNENVLTGKYPFTASGKAFIEGERQGFIKVAVDKNTHKLIGCWIIGAHSFEIIHTASQIIHSGISVKSLKPSGFFHPSLTEGLLNAITHALGCCTELPNTANTAK